MATKLTGHLTEAVYRRYAISNDRDLTEGVARLAEVHTKGTRLSGNGGERAEGPVLTGVA